MELIRGRHNLRPRHRGCVATIGSFDGLHLGHRALLDQLAAAGERLDKPCVVVTFEPLPREFFRGPDAPPRLTRLGEKIALLQGTPLDYLLCLRFDAALARWPAAAFIEELLVGQLGIVELVVGDDFRFGYRGLGDYATLVAAGARFGFAVRPQATVDIEGGRVSSTRVRSALAVGDFATAKALLGRPYAICGRVARGDQLGRTIGFPTANVLLKRHRPPLGGVFAVEVEGPWPGRRIGVANLGRRPTVGGMRVQLEVHLFDFSGDLYGESVTVVFRHKLRDERRFGSLDELKAQLQRDAAGAGEFFAAGAPGPC
ncbi:MAG: bifunctional riboflavin kinase/FAD synthetase [Candidatus Competibacterales bacterium]